MILIYQPHRMIDGRGQHPRRGSMSKFAIGQEVICRNQIWFVHHIDYRRNCKTRDLQTHYTLRRRYLQCSKHKSSKPKAAWTYTTALTHELVGV